MEKVIYRELEKKDYPEIENLIVDSFGLRNYIQDEKALTQMKRNYLYSCLAEQTYCRIAEQNGKVVGVIMGCADDFYKVSKHLTAYVSTLWHSMRMELLAKRKGYSIGDYHHLHQIYRRFLAVRPRRYDGVLTLFAVDASCRGQGVGTQLLNDLEAYFQTCQVERIYLYTDSSCNTGFYDSHGFTRAEQQDMTMQSQEGPVTLSVYLYEKQYYERNRK